MTPKLRSQAYAARAECAGSIRDAFISPQLRPGEKKGLEDGKDMKERETKARRSFARLPLLRS